MARDAVLCIPRPDLVVDFCEKPLVLRIAAGPLGNLSFKELLVPGKGTRPKTIHH